MQSHFYALADFVDHQVRRGEIALIGFDGEQSDFIRLNRGAVRQAGSVSQGTLSIDLIRGARHCGGSLTLANDPALDRERIVHALARYRTQLDVLPDDPHLLYATDVRSSERVGENRLRRERTAILEAIGRTSPGTDLVGIYAAGGIYAGFANSLGQRNWFASHSFSFDWSLYLQGDKAAKSSYAGFAWDDAAFEQKMADARRALDVLARPAHTIAPGRYRVYLAPAAVAELLGMLGWGGFGLKSRRTKHTPLLSMVEAGARLDPRVTIRENTAEGVAPDFESKGFAKPASVTLIERGVLADALVSPRSAKEYGVPTNGADAYESPASIDLAPGDLPSAEVLRQLDTGIYINNLWYLNYSDRPAARITGMTRFATFWVERGEIRAPLSVMRFDDTLYNLLGAGLQGLTREREFLIDPGTYGARSTASSRVPGALIGAMTFTL